MNELREKILKKTFDVLVIVKGIDSVLELFAGTAVLFVSSGYVASLANTLTRRELVEDPKDLIAHGILDFAHSFSADTRYFLAAYLLLHGAVKLFLVLNLLRNKRWAYPATMIFLGLFLAYQIDRLTYSFSILFLGLSVFDAVLLVLVWHEYRYFRMHALTN